MKNQFRSEKARYQDSKRGTEMQLFSTWWLKLILAGRISNIVVRVIFENKRGFIQDHYIQDSLIISPEAINMMSKKCWVRNVIMKVDISKTFDTLDWNFILRVLNSLGGL